MKKGYLGTKVLGSSKSSIFRQWLLCCSVILDEQESSEYSKARLGFTAHHWARCDNVIKRGNLSASYSCLDIVCYDILSLA